MTRIYRYKHADCSRQAYSPTISNPASLGKYLSLPQGEKIIAEYVWIDSTGGTRSKARVSPCVNLSNLLLVDSVLRGAG